MSESPEDTFTIDIVEDDDPDASVSTILVPSLVDNLDSKACGDFSIENVGTTDNEEERSELSNKFIRYMDESSDSEDEIDKEKLLAEIFFHMLPEEGIKRKDLKMIMEPEIVGEGFTKCLMEKWIDYDSKTGIVKPLEFPQEEEIEIEEEVEEEIGSYNLEDYPQFDLDNVSNEWRMTALRLYVEIPQSCCSYEELKESTKDMIDEIEFDQGFRYCLKHGWVDYNAKTFIIVPLLEKKEEEEKLRLEKQEAERRREEEEKQKIIEEVCEISEEGDEEEEDDDEIDLYDGEPFGYIRYEKLRSQVDTALLCDREILKELKRTSIIIHKFNPRNLGNCYYNITLGEIFYKHKNELNSDKRVIIQTHNPWSSKSLKKYWGEPIKCNKIPDDKKSVGEQFGLNVGDKYIVINPGESLLAHSYEFIGGRHYIAAKISPIGRLAKCGLSIYYANPPINVYNRISMRITNDSESRLVLMVGRPIGQVSFYYCSEPQIMYEPGYVFDHDVSSVIKSWKPQMMLI